jgi:hypothetical protein
MVMDQMGCAILTILVLTASVTAAPAPWGIALNHETKECGGYWPGDEYVDYRLPGGWKEYRPKSYGINSSIETESGTCSFKIGDEEKCCQELGYKYVGRNIGKRVEMRSRMLNNFQGPSCFPILLIVAVLVFVGLAVIGAAAWFILKRVKKKDGK